NFLHVIRDEKRYLLNNGNHRAVALRSLGITHAPCIIQTVTRMDELAVAVKRRVRDNAALYFGAARPPMLKDYFDPKIRKVMDVHRMQQMVEVTFEVRDYLVRG